MVYLVTAADPKVARNKMEDQFIVMVVKGMYEPGNQRNIPKDKLRLRREGPQLAETRMRVSIDMDGTVAGVEVSGFLEPE
jgi:hypothetical protein